MMKKPHALLLPLVLLGLLLATGAGWLVSRPLVQQIPGRPSRVQVTPYQLTSTANNLTTRGMSFTPVDPTHPRVNLTITKDQAVLLCFHEQPELNQAIHYSTQLGMLTSTLHLDSVQDRLAWMITFHVREEISSGPPGSIHVIAEHFTVMFIDATTGQPVISFPFVEVTTIPPVPANTPQPALTPPPAAASQAAFPATPEPAVTPSPLPTSSATPLPLPVPYATRTLTPTITVTVVPTTVVLDNGLAWTECEVPNHEYGLGPDEEILTRCAPKPIWGAADQQRMGQKKDSLYPTFSDLQITIGSDRYETRLMNWDQEGCCRYQLFKNGAVISEIKTVFGAVDPNVHFWNIAGKFVWEIASVPGSLLIVDGVNLTEKYQLEGAYFPYEIQGKMIYVARKNGKYQVMVDQKPIGPEFDRISMPYCCGLTRLLYGSGQYWFVGSHDGRMVLVSIAVAGKATPRGLEKADSPTVAPTATPTIPEPATPTPIPASWKTFSDAALKIQFRYPAEWQTGSPLKLKGADGFIEVSLQDYPASFFDVMRTVCVLEANAGRPAAYGAAPLISDWLGWDAEHRAWVGHGCSVMPSAGMPPDGPARAVLYVRYPPPQMPNKLLVLRADAAHFAGILNTLRFQEYTPSTPSASSGYYNSPACDVKKVGKPLVVLRTDRLVITETALAHKDCDPWLHFDGFQTLDSISGAQEARRAALKNGAASSGGSANQTTGVADPFRYEYASEPLFPVGAPSQVRILRDGQVVDTLSVAHAGPPGYPVVGFWSWKGHWLLEMDGVVVEDGELMNRTLKYAQIFSWHLVNDEPFFLFQRESSYGIHYAGQELPLRYDDIIHGQLCCERAAYSVINTPSGAWFYALKGDIWTMVQVQLK